MNKEELNLDYQKAYEVFKDTMREGNYLLAVKFALEKQIPKKGSIKYLSSYTDDPPVLLCPNCQEHIPTEGCNFYKYCYKCGQALDWGDGE